MKTWFVFEIDGKKIAAWANNEKEAADNLKHLYGDTSMKYVGIYWSNGIGEKPDEFTHDGMSPTDAMIATGTLKRFSRFGFAY